MLNRRTETLQRFRIRNWCSGEICAGCSRLFSSKRIPDVIIDTNVNISCWPFRRLAGDEIPDLVARLRKQNVEQAWAGNFDGIPLFYFEAALMKVQQEQQFL
jgi:hypothetical protein